MTDANTICHDVDLLGDWLDSRGYTEEAGLCLRVLGLIHEQAEENEKLRAENDDLQGELKFERHNTSELFRVVIEPRGKEIEKLRAALKPFAKANAIYWPTTPDEYRFSDDEFLVVSDLRAAAAALKETGDD